MNKPHLYNEPNLMGTPQNLLLKLRNFLRWSERYTKTDMVYLASGGFWLTLGQVGIGLIAFGLSIAFAYFVPKDVYGTYRFLLSLFWTLTGFSLTGLGTAVARAVARGEEDAYRRGLRLTLLGSIPMSLISTGVAAYYFYNDNSLLGLGALCVAFAGPLFLLGLTYGPFLEGKKEFRRNSLFGLLLNGVTAIALLVTMLMTKNPLAFFLVYLLGNALMGITLGILTFRIYKPNRIPSKELNSLTGHYSAMNILATVATQIDQLLVFHYLGAVQLALYTFAMAMPNHIKTMLNSVSNLAFPKFAQRTTDELEKTLGFRTIGFMGAIALVVIVYIICAPFLFELLLPAYVEAVPFSRIYALALIPVASMLPEAVLQSHAAKRELYIYNIASPIFQIIILFVLIINFGLLGAVIARIVGRTFNLMLSSVLVKNFFKTSATHETVS